MNLFTKKTPAVTSPYIDVRNTIALAIASETPGTDEFKELLHELERIDLLIQTIKPSWSFKPSADVLANGGFALLCILLTTKHEELNVITSKAVQFWPKLLR